MLMKAGAHPFQNRCLSAVARLAETEGYRWSYHEHQGRRESFIQGTLENAARCLDVYVYFDEVGFMTPGGGWTLCEGPDFDDDDSLIEQFISHLRTQLG